jgi:hypothetical protein
MSHKKHPPSNAVETIEQLAAEGHAIIGIAKKLGVAKETFKRWCDEDQALQEAFELGRETERQKLHALIVQSAVLNKPANVNAFFILKARHGYRENDPAHSNINVGVSVASNVLVVHSHGSDAEWEAKAVEHQRSLVANAASPPKQIEATITPPAYVPPADAAPAWIPAHLVKATPQTAQYSAPEWQGNP